MGLTISYFVFNIGMDETEEEDMALPAEVANNLKFPLHMDYLVLF